MSTNVAVASAVAPVRKNKERGHIIRLYIGYFIAIALVVAIAAYGFNYYTLSSADRPFSPKHALLKPSGTIGVKLGLLGFGMFLAIFLYPLRKISPWLARQGSAKHWLDIHVLLGVSAPFIIAFHSAFKFGGFAGMAFWIMLAVSVSGLIGRYLYSQIPRRLSTAELSLKELHEVQATLAMQLAQQRLLPDAELRSLLRLPSREQVQKLPMLVALVYMMVLDVARWFRVAKLRRHALGLGATVTSLGGFLRTRHSQLERAIGTAREEAAMSKQILFLSRSQQVFHLWHVVHKPFSYSFAVLALIHIGVVISLGFM
jgi:hypothetical protein